MATKKNVSVEPVLDEKEVVSKKTSKKVEEKAPELDRESLKQELKAEILNDMVGDNELVEVKFKKTTVKRSAGTAERLNKQRKIIAVWEAEEGEKAGTAEPVRINGAVAWIPKGVPVLVPEGAAKAFKKYLRTEQTVGKDIPNSRGGLGIRVDEDEALKNALDL